MAQFATKSSHWYSTLTNICSGQNCAAHIEKEREREKAFPFKKEINIMCRLAVASYYGILMDWQTK